VNPQPRSEPMQELARLLAAEDAARARIGTLNATIRSAGAELAAAREALTALEASDPTAQQRTSAEKRYQAASAEAGQPWQERQRGVERAVAAAHQAVQVYVAEHFDTLVDELEQNGRHAAEQVDQAAEQFLAAVAARADADRTLSQTVSFAQRLQPGEIAFARSDEAATAVRRLLDSGGEAAPTLRTREPVAL
jgi:hypothetical protein